MEYTQNPFYSGARWLRFRQKILRRDKYQCQRCKRYGRITEATEVHHIEHLEDAPERAYDPSNVVSLCHRCHNAQHPEKAATMNQNKRRWRYT